MKNIWREASLEIGFVVFVVGLLSFVVSAVSIFLYGSVPRDLKELLVQPIHDKWDGWMLLFGLIMLVVGGWVFGDRVVKIREFRKLISTTSKATFIRNLDRIEYLAWRLTSQCEQEVIKKKKEFKVEI